MFLHASWWVKFSPRIWPAPLPGCRRRCWRCSGHFLCPPSTTQTPGSCCRIDADAASPPDSSSSTTNTNHESQTSSSSHKLQYYQPTFPMLPLSPSPGCRGSCSPGPGWPACSPQCPSGTVGQAAMLSGSQPCRDASSGCVSDDSTSCLGFLAHHWSR